jgi:hypothetical protein
MIIIFAEYPILHAVATPLLDVAKKDVGNKATFRNDTKNKYSF